MALILHVEFDASSESTATKMLELLSRMANIVHRDHSDVYTYVFRQDNQIKSKLIFTEIYANEQVFIDHASDPEFSKLYLEAFNNTSGESAKELCIRNDINDPLSPTTAHILNNYLHVTHIPLQQGFLYHNIPDKTADYLLIVCTGCDEKVYDQLNKLVTCVTCVTFDESDGNKQLIAIVVQFSNEKLLITDKKVSIDTMELVCSQEETIQKFQNIISNYFQIQSLHIQTNFSGYIYHNSSQ